MVKGKDGKRAIYVDCANQNQIQTYIKLDERHLDKFRFIVEIILGGHRNTNVYDKEEVTKKCKGVTAMKFFKGQENDRIYCKEQTDNLGQRMIVMSVLHEKKKSQNLSAIEIGILENIGGYTYEVQG